MPFLPTSGREGSNIISKKSCLGEFPGGLVVRTQHFPCCGPGSIPGWGTKIPQAVWHGQKKKIVLKNQQYLLYRSSKVLLYMMCSRSLKETCIQATWA